MTTVLILRLSRICFVVAVALFFTLVAYGNVTDYGSNFLFVTHVLSMDDTFKSPSLMGRALTSPQAHHAAYAFIIAWQTLTALLCWWGAIKLWRARAGSPDTFHQAKNLALIGLSAGALLYAVGFITVGGEWFAMWQSQTWNGQEKAHIFLMFIGLALLHLNGSEATPS